MSQIFKFYCPTRFEVPASYRNRTVIFGMGKRNAEKLAAELSTLDTNIIPVIFGCAGSLRVNFKPGNVFKITKMADVSLSNNMDLPEAALISSPFILKTAEEKEFVRERSEADLVDLEMDFIWRNTSSHVRERLVFLRGVIDGANDDISFLGERGPDFKKLIFPTHFVNFIKFIGNWRRYLKGMEKALTTYSYGSDHPPHKERGKFDRENNA